MKKSIMRHLGIEINISRFLLLLCSIFLIDLSMELSAQEFQVGTTYLQFTDESRIEEFTEEGAKRKVYAQVWYPSDVGTGETVPYVNLPSKSLGIIASLFQRDSVFMERFAQLKTNSWSDVPVDDSEKFPLLIFQHGYSFWMNQNHFLMEHLAANGYIVVSIAHAFETNYGVNTDGNIESFDLTSPGLQARWGEILNDDISEKYARIMDEPFSESTINLEKELQSLQPNMESSVRLWADDASFVISEFQKLNGAPDSKWFNRIDLNRIGALGMSFGGAATGQLLVKDPRVKAGICMDGAMYGDIIRTPLDRPFLFFLSGNHKYLNELYFQQSKSEVFKMMIADSKHLDFCDLNLVAPEFFKSLGLMGGIDKGRINQLLNDQVLGFFDRYLKSKKDEFPKVQSYPEITLRTRNFK